MHYQIIDTPHGMKPSDLSRMAREALAILLAQVHGMPCLPEISVNTGGKPYFPEYPEIHFSLSHCSRGVLAAVASRPVGCDIEDIQTDVSEELLDVALSEREKQAVLDSKNREEAFTLLWTRKESVVKRDGVIPDNPREWPSEAPGLVSKSIPERGYAFSIAT